jgi:hypothetical protein
MTLTGIDSRESLFRIVRHRFVTAFVTALNL